MGQFCRHCGQALVADDRFCRGCGRAVEAGAVAPAAAIPVAPYAAAVPIRARRGRGPMLLGCLFLVAVIVVVGILAFGSATAGAADVVTAHLSALAKNDDSAAYELTSPAFRGQTTLGQFTQFVNANAELRSGAFTITGRSIDGDTGGVTVDLTGAGGAKRSAEFRVTKIGSAWKITGYELGAVGARPTASPPVASAAAGGAAPGHVPCSATAQQEPSTAAILAAAPKARVRLIAGPIDPKDASGNSVQWSAFPETSTRAFSLAGLKAKTSETVNLLFDAPTVADFPRSAIDMELCDASNTTKFAHSATPSGSSSDSAGIRIAMLGNGLPDAPGTGYRIDAYVWLASTNKWYLAARMTGVSFIP